MPDNVGFLWFMEKWNCFHLRASFSIGQTSRGRCETRREGRSFSGGLAGKEPAAQAGGPELGPSEPTSKLDPQPPLWVGWQQRVLQLCWPVSLASQSYAPLKELHRVSKSVTDPI